jgi:hypothetical protein
VSKNWIKQLHTLPVLHFNRCLNNWIQWNNSTLQRQLPYWQPNLRTVDQVHSDFPNALYYSTHAIIVSCIFNDRLQIHREILPVSCKWYSFRISPKDLKSITNFPCFSCCVSLRLIRTYGINYNFCLRMYLTENTVLILRANMLHSSNVNQYLNVWTNLIENPKCKTSRKSVC